jgi:hypothetical protein
MHTSSLRVSSGRNRPGGDPRLARVRRLTPLAVLGLWSALALLVQRWATIADGIREQYAYDTRFYEVISRAAPSFPDDRVLRPYAERFPVHWLVGTIADLTGAPLESVYRATTIACVAAAVVLTHAAIRTLRLDARAHAVALGLLAASAYPLHYLLAAPGMVSDALFLAGLAAMLLGFVRGRLALVLLGLGAATLARQTAVPVALVACVWVAVAPAWRQRRVLAAAATLAVPLGLYGFLREVGDAFASPHVGDVHDLTIVGFLVSPSLFAEHVARLVLGIAVPSAVVLGVWWRTRGHVPRGPLLVAAAIVVQPFLLGPSSTGDNETRLAALSLPALAVAAAALLASTVLERRDAAVLVAAVALAGLHPRYTWPPPYSSAVWAALVLVCAIVVLVVAAGPRAAPEVTPRGYL